MADKATMRRKATAIEALREIARVSIPELNPDGEDQAAETMRLIACETLRVLGERPPEQRRSVRDG